MEKIGSTPKKIGDDAVPYRSFSRNYGKNFMRVSRGLGKMDKESDEYKKRVAKFYDLNAKYHKALDKIEPELNAMRNNFNAKWLMPEDEEELALCEFGEWEESGILALRFKKEEEKKMGDNTTEAKKCGMFYDRASEFAVFCEEFKKKYGKMLQEKGDEFWNRYLGWCESTEEEKEKVKELVNMML